MSLVHSCTARIPSISRGPSQWGASIRSAWIALIEVLYEVQCRNTMRQIERHQVTSNQH
jgi:hypothetical protein